MGLGLAIGFIDHLHVLTTGNYSAIFNLHTLQFTTSHTKSSQFDFTSCFLVTDTNNILCFRPYWMANVLQVTKLKVEVGIKVTLRPAVYHQSVRLGAKPLEVHDQRFFVTKLLQS
jgi:hypothetical protein